MHSAPAEPKTKAATALAAGRAKEVSAAAIAADQPSAPAIAAVRLIVATSSVY